MRLYRWAFALLSPAAIASAPVDPTFGYAGRPYTYFVGANDASAASLVIDAAGHLITAGTIVNSNHQMFVARQSLFSPVSMDFTFGTNGVATSTLGSLTYSGAAAVAVDHQNRVVTAGYIEMPTACGADASRPTTYFSAARFQNGGGADGQSDLSFGTGFIRGATAIVPGNCEFTVPPTSLAIDDNDAILVAGNAWNGTHSVVAVVKWNSSGVIDLKLRKRRCFT